MSVSSAQQTSELGRWLACFLEVESSETLVPSRGPLVSPEAGLKALPGLPKVSWVVIFSGSFILDLSMLSGVAFELFLPVYDRDLSALTGSQPGLLMDLFSKLGGGSESGSKLVCLRGLL